MKQNWLLQNINKIDKSLAKLTKRKKTEITKITVERRMLQQTPLNARNSLGNFWKTYI
jgi:hypothetical protein